MPVHSLPVPLVVGHAMCGLSGPGTGAPPPIGGFHVRHELGRMRGIQIGRLAGVDRRAAADRNVAVDLGVARERRCFLERRIGRLDVHAIVFHDVDAGRAQCRAHGFAARQLRDVAIGEQRDAGHAECARRVPDFVEQAAPEAHAGRVDLEAAFALG
jgi:hypothetical protein